MDAGCDAIAWYSRAVTGPIAHVSRPPPAPPPTPWPSQAPPPPRRRASGVVVKVLGGVLGGLVLGILIGVGIGRFASERSWSGPPIVLTPADESRAAGKDADPTPGAGTTVMRAMPIGRMRATLQPFTEKDPVVATVVAIGAGEDGLELHVVVENRGRCTVTAASGVAYGFDAHGRSAAMNQGGEHYAAFHGEKLTLEPGAHTMIAQKLRHADAATLGLAHVDQTACADGTTWRRP